jgi:Uma2 family endonuclease
VAFVSKQRIEEVGKLQGYWPGPPDLAVGVISPSDTYTEVEEKAIAWLEAGALMVLVLNPGKRTATMYRSLNEIVILDQHASLDLSGIVPGFKIAVKDIFG